MSVKGMAVAIIAGLLIVGAGCAGGPRPSPKDWIIGNWQMYECENYATGEKVPASDLGLSGEVQFCAEHSWTSWREGWPGGRVESSGDWVLISPGVYEIKRGHPFPNAFRVGDELFTIGGFGPDLYRFWYRRQ